MMARISNIYKGWFTTLIAVVYIGTMTMLFSMDKFDAATYLVATTPATALLFTPDGRERKK